MRHVGLEDAADRAVELLRLRPASLGSGRLLCVDGPAGSGKTTLAAAVVDRVAARVLHLDDLYEGWNGLPHLDRQLGPLLAALAADRPGRYRRWDWHAGAWAEEVVVDPASVLVLEGVGAGSRITADYAGVLVWVEAPPEVRMRRGIERDGDAFAPYWEAWAAAETVHFARQRTRERADLVVTTG